MLTTHTLFTPKQPNSYLTHYMNILLEFYKRWKISANPQKTKLIIIISKKNTNKIVTPLVICDTPLLPKKRVKYLRITFDEPMSFKIHISTAIQTVIGAEQKLYSLISPTRPYPVRINVSSIGPSFHLFSARAIISNEQRSSLA